MYKTCLTAISVCSLSLPQQLSKPEDKLSSLSLPNCFYLQLHCILEVKSTKKLKANRPGFYSDIVNSVYVALKHHLTSSLMK